MFRRGANSIAKKSKGSPFSKTEAGTPAPSAANAGSKQSAFAVHFPVHELQGMLPDHLKSRVVAERAAGLVVSIPVHRIVPQLATGGITLSFGELRKANPEAFTPDCDADEHAVCLPLAQVLPRIDPRFLQRRAQQQKVEVPDDCASPFEAAKTNEASAEPEPPKSQESTIFIRKSAQAKPQPAIPVAPPALKMPDSIPLSPATSRPGSSPIQVPGSREELRKAISQPPAQRAVSTRPTNGKSKAPSTQGAIIFNVSDLSAAWPEALQQQLQDCISADATLALPREAVAPGLKEGRIAFCWKTLRGWITPQPGAQVSAYDQLELELPLKEVSAAFLSKRAPVKAPKVDEDLDETLPDLFCPTEPPARKIQKVPLLDDHAPIPMPRFGSNGASKNAPEIPMVPFTPLQEILKSPSDTATIKRATTPDEAVVRATALNGVAGAIIALPDGLPVASRLPREYNAETVAAVLPQMFARLSEYTNELQLGKIDTIEFTSSNIPWRLFRTRNLVFAAMAHKGKSLPFTELTALVQEMQATTE